MSLAAANAASPGTALKDLSPEVRAALQPRWGGFLAKGGVALILAVLLGVSYYPVEVNNWTFLITDAGNMAVFISDFLKPDFTDLGHYVETMIETVQIALWGSALSFVVGVPCCLLSSTNIAPAWVVQPMRRLIDLTSTRLNSSPYCAPRLPS